MPYEFPWKAWLQSQKEKSEQPSQGEYIGKMLGSAGEITGNVLKQKREQQAQQQFGRTLSASQSPVQGPPTADGSAPAQPPVDIAQLTQLFGKAYPGQENPFIKGMANKAFPSPESQYQAQKIALDKKQLELEQKKVDMNADMEKAKLLELAGYHQESAALRKETIDNMKGYREELALMRSMMFNANQNQKADTKNMGLGGFLRGMFGGGVTPSKVPVPGSDDRSNVRRQLGLQ